MFSRQFGRHPDRSLACPDDTPRGIVPSQHFQLSMSKSGAGLGSNVSIIAAFLGGLVSFLSPCVLPIIPGYLSFMTGLSASELGARERKLGDVLIPAALFVLGFSIVFIALGASASVIGQLLLDYRSVIEKVAGVALALFGILLLGVIKVPWLYREARFDLGKSKDFGRIAAVVMGMSFAAGWTPCVGPILAGILALAGSSGSMSSGVLLLAAYSAGLGVPFLIVAVLFGRMTGFLRWLNRHALVLNRVAGATLVVLGILVFTGRMGLVSSWLTSTFGSVSL